MEYKEKWLRAGDGDLLTCGANDNGQLGVKGRECSSAPIRVAALDAVSVHHVAMGLSHTVAVVGDGMPATWGANELGQLGAVCHPKSCGRALISLCC